MAANIPWSDLADVYGFIGNSLLKPMTQTATVGIDPGFWGSFPDFGNDGIAEAVAGCRRYAEASVACAAGGKDPVERVSVEYTRLFIGPPSPAAPPWETMYRSENVTVGFGEPTFEMKRLLREAGLELSNENHQYEDHMGIELLYLSTRCASLGSSVEYGSDEIDGEVVGAPDPADSDVRAALDFIERHPLGWIGAFRDRVARAYPDGYFVAVLGLAERVLMWHAGLARDRD
ncbi:TorD/DmsD family molecular chaperone [Raoultibacter massiliensis]|uniref:TorD/DmsD family molecular chaperone n=1 Tax=Raoultibacter massiliensis TaxID=1852371 RepID=UPI003A8DB62E